MGRVAASKHEEFAQARRDSILNAALKVFAQKGFAEAKMDQVAAAADLSKAALYLCLANPAKHFASRTAAGGGRHQGS